MSYNLFLDDVRIPFDKNNDGIEDAWYYTHNPAYIDLDWVIVRNYKQFISYIIKNGLPNLVSFDHDLADEHYKNWTHPTYDVYSEKTGYHCAKWLCEYCQNNNLKFPKYLIHSFNGIGSKNIYMYIENYKKQIEQ
jgi:hypothetical protein